MLNKRRLIILAIVSILSSCVSFMTVKNEGIVTSPEAEELHKSFPFVADLHSDALIRTNQLWKDKNQHVNIPKMRKGNAALEVFGIVTKASVPNMCSNKEPMINLVGIFDFPRFLFGKPYKKALKQIKKFKQSTIHDEKFHMISSKCDLENLIELRKEDRNHVGGMLCIEGIHCIEDSISRIDELHDLGVRIIGLNHFFDNRYSGSQSGIHKYGVTRDGEILLNKLAQKNMILDLAHASESTIDWVLENYPIPPIISHVGCYEVQKSNRNLRNLYLTKVLDAGGLVGAYFFNPVERSKPSTDLIIKHIAHLIEINNGNVEGISLGSDYDGVVPVPFDISDLRIITSKLLEHNISPKEIEQIMGGNVRDYFLTHLN